MPPTSTETYTPPKLSVYGSLEELTQGSGSGHADGMGNRGKGNS